MKPLKTNNADSAPAVPVNPGSSTPPRSLYCLPPRVLLFTELTTDLECETIYLSRQDENIEKCACQWPRAGDGNAHGGFLLLSSVDEVETSPSGSTFITSHAVLFSQPAESCDTLCLLKTDIPAPALLFLPH